jgi:putative hydrolase of the HAD superfamily
MDGVPAFTTVFLDVDDTLYPSSSGVWQAIGQRINLYMQERLGIPSDRVRAVRDDYFRTYGTTLNGLIVNFDVNPLDYLTYVHDIPLEEMLRPDPELRSMLEGMPQQRVVLTNASREHAERVMRRLGIREVIDRVIDILDLEMTSKPQPEAYLRALTLVGESDPSACVAVDDLLANLETAHGLGMTTVLVARDGEGPVVDYRIARLAELAGAVPGLRARLSSGPI